MALDGRMVDAPVAARARRVVARHQAIAAREGRMADLRGAPDLP